MLDLICVVLFLGLTAVTVLVLEAFGVLRGEES